jgi:hypothetical protein
MSVTIRFLLTLVVALTFTNCLAWNATGHMVIADIALRSLKPRAKVEALRLLHVGGTADTTDFRGAAVWADDTRTKENGSWHYIDIFFRQDGKPTSLRPDAENVVWAIDKFSRILADKSRPDLERADALRYLLHFVGDIHQPLHCTALVSDQFPTGDRGGNLYAVEPRDGTRRPHNLHYLWDEGAGIFTRVERPLDAAGEERIKGLADSALSSVSSTDLKVARQDRNPMDWAKEGQTLAKTAVYVTPDGQTPTQPYIASAQKLSQKRAVIAGFRLADLLNRLLAS